MQKIYTMFDEGYRVSEICEQLNTMGCRTARGAKFNKNSLRTILRNEKYIGVYQSQGIRVEGGVPAIIDRALFDRVQARIATNKRCPARYKAHAKYALSGKLYCGLCGSGMIGVSAHSKTGAIHYYYGCTKRAQDTDCTKKNIRRDVLDNLVAAGTVKYILQDDERIDRIARRCVEVQAANPTANAELDFMQAQLADAKKSLDNLLTAIENGIITKTTKQRLQELEDMQAKLEYEIEGYKLRAPELNERQIKYMLHQMQQKEDEPDDEYRERLLDCFVNAVYLYEDKAVVMFNLTSNKATLESVTLPLLHDTPPDGESSCSDLFGGASATNDEHSAWLEISPSKYSSISSNRESVPNSV